MWEVILLCALTHNVFATELEPISIEGGRIRGFASTLDNDHGCIHKYLGIRYARANRFERPRRIAEETWEDVKEMNSFGKICHQPTKRSWADGPFFPSHDDMDEDCLNLNVYVPSTPSSSPRAVMFWIHGGGFAANSNRISDGSYLANIGDVIVVTINYRLHVLGFLHHRPSGLTGNYGLYDQLEALNWVNRNIASFGGDPNRVTIFGNSAGGVSVSLLCLSPLATGLFKYAIMQSGVSNMPVAYNTYEDEPSFDNYKNSLQCEEDVSFIDCIKSVDINIILDVNTPYWVLPVVDGEYIPDTPLALLENGNFMNPESTMIGVASDDGSCFTNVIPALAIGPVNITRHITRELFKDMLNGFSNLLYEPPFGQLARRFGRFVPFYKKAVIHQYSRPWEKLDKTSRNRRKILNFLKDSTFIAPAISHADAFVQNGAQVFFYQVDHGLKMNGYNFTVPTYLKAYHETEKFMVFGFPLKRFPSQPEQDREISTTVIRLWSNFAKTGDPNPVPYTNSSTPRPRDPWPEYDPDERKYMSIQPSLEVRNNTRVNYMPFWHDYLPSLKQTVDKECGSEPEGSGTVPGSAEEVVTGSAEEVVTGSAEEVVTGSVEKDPGKHRIKSPWSNGVIW